MADTQQERCQFVKTSLGITCVTHDCWRDRCFTEGRATYEEAYGHSRTEQPQPDDDGHCYNCESGECDGRCECHKVAQPTVQPEPGTLHTSICQAVALMNMGKDREAHDLLRKTLVDYADSPQPEPSTEGAREWLRSKEVFDQMWRNADPTSKMSREDQEVWKLEAYTASLRQQLQQANEDKEFWKRDALILVTLLRAKCSDSEWAGMNEKYKALHDAAERQLQEAKRD